MPKTYIILYVFLSILTFFKNVNANEYTIKLNYGLVNHDKIASSSNDSVKFDNNDEGFIASLSKDLNNIIGYEFIYYDLGESSISGNSGEAFLHDGGSYQFQTSGTISRNTSGFGAGGIVSSSKFYLNSSGYFKLGFHYWDHSGSTDLLTGSYTFESHYYNTGYDLYSGLGLDFEISNQMKINVDYSFFSFNDSTFGQIIGTPSTLLSIGLGFSF